jgi:hypothetical protein
VPIFFLLADMPIRMCTTAPNIIEVSYSVLVTCIVTYGIFTFKSTTLLSKNLC